MKSTEVTFASGGEQVSAVLVRPDETEVSQRGVVFVHGATSSNKNYIPIAEELAKNGIVGLAINLRGHSSPEGLALTTVNDGIRDGFNAYDFLLDQGVDPTRVGFCGASLGGTIAAMVSGKKEVKTLVLRAPATYTGRMLNMTFAQIMSDEREVFNNMIKLGQTPPYKAISKFEGDLLLITSENDKIIPAKMTHGFFSSAKNARSKKKVIIEGATHQLTESKWINEFRTQTIDWISKTL